MSDNNNELGKRIKNIRISLGDNMREFGLRFKGNEASDSIVSRWEKGKSIPNPERLKKIAEIGNISINELLYGNFKYYLFNNITIDKNECGLEFIDDEIRMSFADYLTEYTFVREINDDIDYSILLNNANAEIPLISKNIIESGKIFIDEMNKKDFKIIEKYKHRSKLIEKFVHNEHIQNVDFIKNKDFLLTFQFENYLFDEEKEYAEIDLFSKVFKDFHSIHNKYPKNNEDVKRFLDIKSKSQEVGKTFDYSQITNNPIAKKISNILSEDIPAIIDNKIRVFNENFKNKEMLKGD